MKDKIKGIVFLLVLVMNIFMIPSVNAAEDFTYDYSSFVGTWEKIDPDGMNGEVLLEIIEVTENEKIKFIIDGGEVQEAYIRDNQVQWTETWWDGEMGQVMTFYDDHIHLQYSRYSIEWYNEITFVSDTVHPRKMQNNASENIKIMINGEEVISDVAPLAKPVYVDGKHTGDRVMVPIRVISEKLNFDVYWNQTNKGINIYRKNHMYIMWVEKETAFRIDGAGLDGGYKMDVPPTIVNDRTLVPVRAVAELLGAKVEWIGETKTVDITYDLGNLENNTGYAEKTKNCEEILFVGYDVFSSYIDGTIETLTGKFVLENGKEIKFELYPQLAPDTVAQFVGLANGGAYENTIFHRVIDGFMAQGGGYFANNEGYIQTENIKGEFIANSFPNLIAHDRGVLSYARANDYNSGSSQFFIVQTDSPHLEGYYAAFGKVTEGIEVVDEICKVETDANDRPLEDIVVKQVVFDKVTQ